MKKIIGIIIALYFICMAGMAHADLTVIGTVTYLGSDYKLIWDDDNNGNSVIWLDYANSGINWQAQNDWAVGLDSILSYNIDTAYAVDWIDNDWRLGSTVDGPYIYASDGTGTAGYNITHSEMGHLFYEELGNLGYVNPDGSTNPGSPPDYWLQNTGPFDNLQPTPYWSGTEFSIDTDLAWAFGMSDGYQSNPVKYGGFSGLAVRTATVNATVPELVSIDIIPKTCPNECPIKGGGAVEVVIHGTADFDVNDIDIASVRLERVAPTRSNLKDKSSPILPPPTDCECTTEGRDGFVDLCLKFDKKAIITELGGVVDLDIEYPLTLTGNKNDGTPIEGQDCIVFVKKGKKD